jgi:hypothetical protein
MLSTIEPSRIAVTLCFVHPGWGGIGRGRCQCVLLPHTHCGLCVVVVAIVCVGGGMSDTKGG